MRCFADTSLPAQFSTDVRPMFLINTIRRVKVPLIIVAVLSAILILGEFYYLHSAGGKLQPSKIENTVALIPPFILWLCLLSLIYLSWFSQFEINFIHISKLIFFIFILLGSVAIFIDMLI